MLAAMLMSVIPAATLTVQPAGAMSICDWAQFIADVTVPDGTNFAPGATYSKTWRLKNIGSCTWTTSYTLVFDSGSQMGGPSSVNFPGNVAPGQTVDLSINLTAPSSAGHYIGFWKFKNASGVLFGIGSTANKPWWVEINVSGSTAGVAYDFAANYCSATWYSIQGNLPCPGTDGDSRGFVLKVDKPQLENGAFDTGSGLITNPQNAFNGDIHGIYPAFHVQRGDRFQSVVNCAYGATSCYVTFRLDYEIGNGPINTLWTWREKYEGLFFRTNVDLSSLAGQDVKFILTVLATGSATGDRALWSNPAIVRFGSTPATPTPGPGTPTSTPITPASCDRSQFIADVTVPDGTLFVPGAAFTKTWRLKNVGTCTWTTSYKLIFDTGSQMGGPSSVNLPGNVAPGQTVDLTISLTAPNAGGSYRGYWKFKNANGIPFGIGADGTKSWWVDIRVSGATATPFTPTPGTAVPTSTPVAGTMYDFAANVCSGVWFSSVGQLHCPGTDGDPKGFVLQVASPQLENGTVDSRQGLVTYPQNINNGYIQGIFPPYHVKPGDRFRSIINCAYGSTSCYVVFRLDYQTGTGPITTYWAFVEKYDGQFYQADLDLSPLVGQDIKFILTVLATGSPVGDRALWVAPMIYNASFASTPVPATPTSTPTNTPTPSTAVPTTTGTNTTGWNTYQNTKFGFSFQFPPGSSVSGQTDNSGHIDLPILISGTNLHEKYLDVGVVEDASTCKSPLSGGPDSTSENITINGTPFLKESGSQGAAGNFYDWTQYSSFKGTDCLTFNFVMHSVNPGVYETPPPLFDKTAESAVFTTIMSTFFNQ